MADAYPHGDTGLADHIEGAAGELVHPGLIR
jgi:hypothetical protein